MTCWGPGPARKQEMSERTARPPKIFKWFILALQTYHLGRFHNHGEGPTKASMLNNPPVPYDMTFATASQYYIYLAQH